MELEYAAIGRVTENFPRHLARSIRKYRVEIVEKITDILTHPPVSPTDLAYVYHLLMDCPDPDQDDNVKEAIMERYKLCEVIWKFFVAHRNSYSIAQEYRLVDCVDRVFELFYDKYMDKSWENHLDEENFSKQAANLFDDTWKKRYKDNYGDVFEPYTEGNTRGITNWGSAYASKEKATDVYVHRNREEASVCSPNVPVPADIELENKFDIVKLRRELSGKLCAMLDWRLLVDMLFAEMTRSIRKDDGYGDSKRRTMVSSLARTIETVGKFLKHSMNKGEGEEVIQKLTHVLGCDDETRSLYNGEKLSMVNSRLMVNLLPNSLTMDIITDRRLFTWWGFLEQGRISKFDLQWFKFLARYAKARWCQRMATATGTDISINSMKMDPEKMAACDRVIAEMLPWLMNKILRSLQVPAFSPVANTLQEGGFKLEHVSPFERLRLPSEVDSLMGATSTWRFVTKFLVFHLEPTPFPSKNNAKSASRAADNTGKDEQIGGSSGSSSSGRPLYWEQLTTLIRRISPYVQNGMRGEWTWHCATFIHHLVRVYFTRAARERMCGETVKIKNALHIDGDTHFQFLVMPILRNFLKSREQTEQGAAMDCIPRIARLMNSDTLKLCDICLNIEEGGADPDQALQEMLPRISYPLADQFDLEDTFYAQCQRQMEILMDPEQSGRATNCFRFFSKIIPTFLKFFPQV